MVGASNLVVVVVITVTKLRRLAVVRKELVAIVSMRVRWRWHSLLLIILTAVMRVVVVRTGSASWWRVQRRRLFTVVVVGVVSLVDGQKWLLLV